jgi:hypothetical protein
MLSKSAARKSEPTHLRRGSLFSNVCSPVIVYSDIALFHAQNLCVCLDRVKATLSIFTKKCAESNFQTLGTWSMAH